MEIEAIQIGDSLPAPMFNIVEKPNDWAKATKASSTITETKKLYLQYWTRYREFVKNHPIYSKMFNPHSAKPQNWTNLAAGSSEYHYGLNILPEDHSIGAYLYIPRNKQLGALAEQNIDLFRERIGIDPVVIDGEVASGLRFYKEECTIANNVDEWDAFLEWQLDTVSKIREVVAEIKL